MADVVAPAPPARDAAPPGQAARYPRFLPLGDSALSVEFGDTIDAAINARVVALDLALAVSEIDGVVETAPSYRALLVCYDPLRIAFHDLVVELRQLLDDDAPPPDTTAVTWSVPVVYGPPYGEDLAEVAQRLALTEEQVVAIHSGAEYQVFMVGFAPGLPYLGPLPAPLHISRRPQPRPSVPAGAVMIGGIQANIVPMPVPSGWYVLGRTPLRLFDRHRHDPFLFRAGDRLRFRRIDAAEFEHMAELHHGDLLPLLRSPP